MSNTFDENDLEAVWNEDPFAVTMAMARNAAESARLAAFETTQATNWELSQAQANTTMNSAEQIAANRFPQFAAMKERVYEVIGSGRVSVDDVRNDPAAVAERYGDALKIVVQERKEEFADEANSWNRIKRAGDSSYQNLVSGTGNFSATFGNE